MESPYFEECLPPRDRGRARIDVIRLKTKNAKLFGGRRRCVSAKWPSRRISRRKVVNKGRTLKEKRCAHSNELCLSHIGDR
jgi:hypothetical protein